MHARLHHLKLRLTTRHLLQITITGTLIMLAVLFMASRIASASQPHATALTSPVGKTISVLVNCGTTVNPACSPKAWSSIDAVLDTHFYVDKKDFGAANTTYSNVCTGLKNGSHTAKVIASYPGSKGQVSARQTIRCSATATTVTLGTYYVRGIVRLSPLATNRSTGIASRSLTVDGRSVAWRSYSDTCKQLSLSKGIHKAIATVTDKSGSTRSSVRRIVCR